MIPANSLEVTSAMIRSVYPYPYPLPLPPNPTPTPSPTPNQVASAMIRSIYQPMLKANTFGYRCPPPPTPIP